MIEQEIPKGMELDTWIIEVLGIRWWTRFDMKEVGRLLRRDEPVIRSLRTPVGFVDYTAMQKLRNRLPSRDPAIITTVLSWERWYNLNPPKTVDDHRYGEPLDSFIRDEINKMIVEVNDHCIDGVRWARVRKRNEMRRFRNARTCCGCCEYVVTHSSGERIIIGCNYGH